MDNQVQVTLPADLLAYLLRHLKQERAELNGFLALGNEVGRARLYDGWIAALQAAPALAGVVLTPWFQPCERPVRDGVYLVREIRLAGMSGTPVRSDSWHACRWDCHSRAWYSAGSTGRSVMDLIGMDKLNRRCFEWRGLASPAGG